MTPRTQGDPSLMTTDLRALARRLAVRTYRKVGQLGRRVLGEDELDVGLFEAPPWVPLPDTTGVMCNICRWEGGAFVGGAHAEFSHCPACESNGRDRFVHWCFAQRVDLHAALRIIECSPRLGRAYRDAMTTWFFYRTSDYDLRAHKGSLQLDLQAIDLPDASVDVMLCAHVLEHVPDTDKALAELRRVIAPGGHLFLQVPVLQGHTAPPAEPEFHNDSTPVYWRFGFDLTARLRNQGFTTSLLCTADLAEAVASGDNPWATWSSEFDVPAILAAAIPGDLRVVADRETGARLGIEPGYMYFTWDCAVP
jgi:Methyltransferase domain